MATRQLDQTALMGRIIRILKMEVLDPKAISTSETMSRLYWLHKRKMIGFSI